MSRILQQAKVQYKKSIMVQSCLLLVLISIIALWQVKSAVDFSIGFLCAFLPFILFVYCVFFNQQNLSTKMTALYRAEAAKFALTIILISLAFGLNFIDHFMMFFAGFFTSLILNNVIPFILSKV